MTQTTTTRRGRKPKTEVQPESTPELEAQLQEAAEANAQFAEENQRLAKENDALRADVAEIKAMLARNNPVSIRPSTEVAGEVGHDGDNYFNDGGELVSTASRDVDDPLFKEKAEMLKFMNEPVTISITESADENTDDRFVVYNNGRAYPLRQGETVTVPRFVVEDLMRARTTKYRNELRVDQLTGEQSYHWPSKTGLRYPFTIVQDNNPKGKAWVAKVRAEA